MATGTRLSPIGSVTATISNNERKDTRAASARDDDLIAAAMLGFVQCLIGAGQQIMKLFGVAELGDAERSGQPLLFRQCGDAVIAQGLP